MKPVASGTPARGAEPSRPLWLRLLHLTLLVAVLGVPPFLAAGRLDLPWVWAALIT